VGGVWKALQTKVKMTARINLWLQGASESEDEQLTTNSKITASNKLKEKTRIRVDSNAT
jgi:hypothetical protein